MISNHFPQETCREIFIQPITREKEKWVDRLVRVHPWAWLFWRGKSKLPNAHPLEHSVKQWVIIGHFPCFPLQRGLDCGSSVCCHTVAVPVPHQISTFPGLGFESQSRQFVCGVTPMTTHINQSIKLFKKYSPLIDRCWKLREEKKRKKDLDWDSKSRPGNMELELPQHAEWQHTLDTQSNHGVEDNKESAYDCLSLHSVPIGFH